MVYYRLQLNCHPITLPELTIEVRWIDEDGNVLKPSVKTGNEKGCGTWINSRI